MEQKKPRFKEIEVKGGRTRAANQAREAASFVVPAKLDPRTAGGTGGEQPLPPERGGYDGPEPTRFGDWEHKGRCTDF